ncbi:MAG: hypothetical protein M1822_002388 [Bathelium mastoideum]|nr:MAG: hypothetical protein M1822_002388 [Bathelium mastoideum]
MSNDDGRPVDLENPPADLEDVNAPVITELDQMSGTGEEEVLFDGIPTVQKPGYGNWIWVEKRCARRSGLTVGEATTIQPAYRVYQKDGDVEEFFVYVRKFFEGTLTSWKTVHEISETESTSWKTIYEAVETVVRESSERWTCMGRVRRWFRMGLGQALPSLWLDAKSLLVGLSLSSWATWGFATSREHRETELERIHTLNILVKLLMLLMANTDGRSSPQAMKSQHPEPHNHTDNALQTNDKKDILPLSIAHRITRETSQESATPISTVEPNQSREAKQQDEYFDASKLDRRKFDVLVHELLRSRSYESGTQGPLEGSSSPFVVIGWFSKGSSNPYERLVTLKDNGDLFKQLRKKMNFIRGWREFVSLKSLRSFSLYECDIHRGAHVKLRLPEQHKSTLSHFFRAYQTSRWHPDKDVSKAWMTWVHKNLNANTVPIESKYSLELVYNWSPIRLSILVSFPVILSFGTGLIYMLETGDISTAWTISSYIVTAAGGEDPHSIPIPFFGPSPYEYTPLKD